MSPRPFLEVFPREIRDQIYTFVLASPLGTVTLSPWTPHVERSLRLLRTCKQIHRECKDIIWQHNGLKVRPPTELFHRLSIEPQHPTRRPMSGGDGTFHIDVAMELLDRDELEWFKSGLPAIKTHSRDADARKFAITLHTHSERPRCMQEFEDCVRMRASGKKVDGRLYREEASATGWDITSIWPPFAHWGKQNWLREMLLDNGGVEGLLGEMHGVVGGEMWVDGRVCFRDGVRLVEELGLDPRDGEVRMVFEC